MDKKLITIFILLALCPIALATDNAVVNGYFDNNLSGWETQGNVIWNSGHAVIRDDHMSYIKLAQVITLVNNSLSFDAYVVNTTPNFYVQCTVFGGEGYMNMIYTHACNGHTVVDVTGYTHATILFDAVSDGTGTPNMPIMTIDNVENILYIPPVTYPIYTGQECNIKVESTPNLVTLDVTVCTYNNTHYKAWTETSVNHTETSTNTIGGIINPLPANSRFTITKDGVFWKSFVSNSTGYIVFEYTEGFSEVYFTLELTPDNTGAFYSVATVVTDLGNASLNIFSVLLTGSNAGIIISGFVTLTIVIIIMVFLSKRKR
jgi:hypothetical protein